MSIGNIWSQFFDSQSKVTVATAKFIQKPVTPENFFKDWMNQPLFPEQLNPINAMFTPDFEDLNPELDEVILLFGEGCLTGNTKIKLLNGTSPTIEELYKFHKNDNIDIYSCTPEGKICAGNAHSVRITKHIKNLVKIRLDNGQSITCTESHPFMLRDGTYNKAKDLKLGTSLMPLYTKYGQVNPKNTTSKYEVLLQPYTNKWVFTHRMVLEKKKGCVRHHKDLNSLNNTPSNLEHLSFRNHFKLHAGYSQAALNACKQIRQNNPKLWTTYVQKRNSTLRSLKLRQKMSIILQNLYKTTNLRLKVAQASKKQWKNLTYRTRVLMGVSNYYSKNKGIPEFEQYKKYRSKKCNLIRWGKAPHRIKSNCLKCGKKLSNYTSQPRKYCSKNCYHNHKIISIEYIILKKAIPVYDMTVDVYNNFALDSGVFVHNSGKDFLCERMLIYVAYWLICLRSPQKYLGRAEGTPIDLVNTSVNEEHAANVFFEQFCEALKLVINPETGKNWFEEQGMDIRTGRDILTTKVRFPKNITAYSCNSIRWTAEGKNVLIGILDEIAEFKYDKAKALYTNLKATATSRFPDKHKIVLISYLIDEFDFMLSHWRDVAARPAPLRQKVYMSNKATWEVNLLVTREDYADAYEKDPEDSARRYENIIPSKSGQKFLKDGIKITNAVYDFDGSPIISETPQFSTNLNTETLQVWFKPYNIKEIYNLEQELALNPTSPALRSKIDALKDMHSGANYYIHIDLAKGAVDYAGFCLLHTYQKTESQIGYYVDLIVQLQPDGKEINFEQIREFIFKLQTIGYPIAKVSLDGWASVDFMQLLDKRGIPCELVSLDRTMQPYNTLKDILYQEILGYYYNPILLRELNELQIINNKVDHPRESSERLKEEGKGLGSKDLADSLAGAVFTASSAGGAGSGCVVELVPEDPEDKLDKLFGN